MADKTSYIKIDRNIKNWRWWGDHNTVILFLCILLDANIKDHDFCDETIHRGQLATSLQSLCKSTGLSTMQVRTALSHLKLTGEITIRRCPRYQVITIVNYDKYQTVTGSVTGKQQANNNQITRKQQQSNKGNNRGEEGKERKGRSAPESPSGKSNPRRGTDEFRRKAHLILSADEGTVDDIPATYRERFDSWGEYWRFRNQ